MVTLPDDEDHVAYIPDGQVHAPDPEKVLLAQGRIPT
jgi:hypothetical protein